ncbi:MAG: hypothetical protein COA41_09590 [Sphingopyxis sp.]|nr:MAG: hypothetical protein COA41_09590 [Sphingopyxis sp.]
MEKESNSIESPASSRASFPSIIQSFEIIGLHGYRDIAINPANAASILIANNGTGKTTLLGALDAFLKLQFDRLRNLEFSEIRCKLRSYPVPLVLFQTELTDYLTQEPTERLLRVAAKSSLEPSELQSFVIGEHRINEIVNDDAFYNHSVMSKLNQAFGYSSRTVSKELDILKQELLDVSEGIANIALAIRQVLSEYEIVYLPTYRRIELPLADETRGLQHRRRNMPRFRVAAGSLFTSEIQFGLSDIKDRLSSINQEVVFESNNGYRDISANIINDLIDGSYAHADQDDTQVPDREELSLFFSRLREGRKRMGPYLEVDEPDLGKIYTDESAIPHQSKVFLRYFLGKLKLIIDRTRDIERPIEDFIQRCNRYLSSSDEFYYRDMTTAAAQSPIDGKQLKLDRMTLQVRVESLPEERKIPLDSLSSGEKQMISIFSKLFLYPKKKIFLIDEPELSLSIDWQRSVLVDIMSASQCSQLIAITHSPFVFDNELDPFAGSLRTRQTDNLAQFSFDEDLDEFDGDLDFEE